MTDTFPNTTITGLVASSTTNAHIVIILDTSGSMDLLRTEMEGSLRTFINDQAELPGKCTVTIAKFNKELYSYVTKDIHELTPDDLKIVPYGGTALNDAIVSTLSRVRDTTADFKVAVIITDGEENGSVKHTKKQAMEAIGLAEKEFGWQFVYMAATADGFQEGSQYLSQTANVNSNNFRYTSGSLGLDVDCLSKSVRSSRISGQSLKVGST